MKQKKNIGIPFLMIASMLFLIAFVSYWLINQYKLEKKDLYSMMEFELTTSQDVVMDEVIVKYLDPILKDSLRIQGNSFFSRDSLRHDSQVATFQIDIDTSKDGNLTRGTHVYAISGDDKLITSDKSSFMGPDTSIFITGSSSEHFFLQGVKMIMKITEDSAKFGNQKIGEFLPIMDTQKLLLTFDQRILDNTGTDFSVIWTDDSTTITRSQGKIGRNSFIFSAMHSSPGQNIAVGKVFPFVIKKISPQIIFALILILLSGFAFGFTYKSLLKQMELNSTRNEFISNISHELKTPVATVKVALEALRNFDQIQDPVVTQEYLAMATAELDRLDQLTHKVLTHSQLESDSSFIEKKEMDLVSLCENSIKKWQPKIDEQNANLKFLHSDAEIFISADELYLEGVILNLIDNALKYAGPDADIEIELTKDEDELRVSVSDRGPGIARKYQSQVFDKFFRVPSENRHNVKGHGLGLSFAALVMEQHNGEIKMNSRAGGGSIFELIIPREKNEG